MLCRSARPSPTTFPFEGSPCSPSMISRSASVRASDGARRLPRPTGDKIGLVGRNGAGKTTLTKTLAGETLPAGGNIDRNGEIGYLPQDPRSGDPEMLARTRILDARGLGQDRARHEAQVHGMGSDDPGRRRDGPKKYGNLTDRSPRSAGTPRRASRADRLNLNLPDRILDQPLKTLSGGQRRRIELARILFSDAETLILDEPTNHLDADSVVWLREFLKAYKGGVIVITHDVELVGRGREPGVLPRRQPLGDRHLQHGLEELPRQRAADERAASGSGPTPRRRSAP